jgi:hypothetical protein
LLFPAEGPKALAIPDRNNIFDNQIKCVQFVMFSTTAPRIPLRNKSLFRNKWTQKRFLSQIAFPKQIILRKVAVFT